MKLNKDKRNNVIGWVPFLLALGFFCLQMGYLLVHARYQVEYIDNRLFYLINIIWVICLVLSLLFLLTLSKTYRLIVFGVGLLFIIGNGVLLVGSNQQIKNVTSISANFKNVISIKENVDSGEAIYHRSYYGILARPKETLPYKTKGEFKVKWLANDIAAVTYKAKDNTIQQFIGTYGDRGGGNSYYYVGPEIQGHWQADNTEVISDSEGIWVTFNGETELFEWDNISQFGTLAVVLKKDNVAVWTIALKENFEVHSDASKPSAGNISLYKATMEKNKPIILDYTPLNYAMLVLSSSVRNKENIGILDMMPFAMY